MSRSSKPPRGGAPAPLSEAWLHQRALRYLDRFDSSVANLKRVLCRAAKRATEDAAELEAAGLHIEVLVARFTESGLLNDTRFATAVARGLRARGSSSRMIHHKLRGKGLEEGDVAAAVEALREEGSELDAARAYVRRRRLGPYRSPEERQVRARRDLAALARAGYSFEVARRALDADDEVFE